MANYDRDFLVPYLQNISALHLLKNQLHKQHNKVKEEYAAQKHLSENGKTKIPSRIFDEVRVEGDIFAMVLLALLGIGLIGAAISAFAYLIWMVSNEDDAGGIFGMLYSGSVAIPALGMFIGGIFSFSQIIKVKNGIDRKKQQAKEALRAYDLEVKTAEKTREEEKRTAAEKLPALERKLNDLEKKIEEADELLRQGYGANVIPKNYRNIYAALYLYDWFSTSGANDLDHALSMFVLEEIKEDLDHVIRNQATAMLQQQVLLAQQQNDAALLQSKLDQLNASAEEQMRYSKMIAANTATTAYFSTIDYLSD